MAGLQEATRIIESCFGEHGVWASTERYRHQLWTRDFCLAALPTLLRLSERSRALAKQHLFQLCARQNPVSGKIPIVFLDNEAAFRALKEAQSSTSTPGTPGTPDTPAHESFMLRRLNEGQLENLTPHTRDSEILFLRACELTLAEGLFMEKGTDEGKDEYETIQKAMDRARTYLEWLRKVQLADQHTEFPFIAGADWRDTRVDLADVCVLTNACWILPRPRAGEPVPQFYLQNFFWDQGRGYFSNWICVRPYEPDNGHPSFYVKETNSDFDVLGNAIAILEGIASPEQARRIWEYAVREHWVPGVGFKLAGTFLPPRNDHEKMLMDRDKAVVWPFVSHFMLLSMLRKGGEGGGSGVSGDLIDRQQQARLLWASLPQEGQFYECYSVTDGQGYGSRDQLWSACLYEQVLHEIYCQKQWYEG